MSGTMHALTPVDRRFVAAALTRGWSAGNIDGSAIREAFGKNLAAAGDPRAAAILTDGWTMAHSMDGHRVREAYAKNLLATGDAQAAAILTKGWAIAKTREGHVIREAYAKNLAATGDARAAAYLTNGWAIADTMDSRRVRDAYARNLLATGDAQTAAILTNGWTIAKTRDGHVIREAYAKNLAATGDARAAAYLTNGWAIADTMDGHRVRDAYARNLLATGDAQTAAILTNGWTIAKTRDGHVIRDAYAKNLMRLHRFDPEAVAAAETAKLRLQAGTGTDDDVRRLFELYEPAEIRDAVPAMQWRATVQLFRLGVERGDNARIAPMILADARDHLARLPTSADTVDLRRSTQELIERNLRRVTGDHAAGDRRGYADHADYAEVGRVVESVSLLDEVANPVRKVDEATSATASGAGLRW